MSACTWATVRLMPQRPIRKNGEEIKERQGLEDFLELPSEFCGETGAFAARGYGDLDAAALQAGGYQEPAFLGGIGDVGEDALAFGGDADAVIGQSVICGGEDEGRSGEVGCAKAARDDPDRKGVELRLPFGSDDGDARTGFQQALGFAQGDFTRADHEDGLVFQVEKYGVVSQSQTVARERQWFGYD